MVFNGLLLEDSLQRLNETGIHVDRGTQAEPVIRIEESDFSPRIIHQAGRMASVYTAFFSLENAVRELIEARLLERKGLTWWKDCVPEKIQKSAIGLKEKEQKNRYHAPRSSSDIGYTLFGNLAQIIIANWEDFSDLFPDQHWLSSRFNDLELSRNIIMHSGVLPENEIERIESIARDWIRQVG
jgi:hypothetical protein